jgi:hypothetical protein
MKYKATFTAIFSYILIPPQFVNPQESHPLDDFKAKEATAARS